MGRVSRVIIDKELMEDLEEQLSFIVQSLSSKPEIKTFLTEFLTKEEKIMLGKRLVLYMLLFGDFPDAEIINTLSISRETVRLYRQIFQNKPHTFKKTVEKLIKKERNKQFLKKLDKILQKLSLALAAKTNMKARAKFATGDFDS